MSLEEKDDDKLQRLISSIGHSVALSSSKSKYVCDNDTLKRGMESERVSLEALLVYWLS